MKTGLKFLVALMVMSVAWQAHAAEGVKAKELRLGVVSIQRIFKEYKYAKDQEQVIRNGFVKQEKTITALAANVAKVKRELAKEALDDRTSVNWKLKTLKFEMLRVELDGKRKAMFKEKRRQMAEFWRSIYKHFRVAVDLYAKKHQYDLIITAPDTSLSENSVQGNSPLAVQNEILLRDVQFIGKRVDITTQVVAAMNDSYAKAIKKRRP